MSRAADVAADARRVGVFGGTFDPPHLGHVAAAHDVAEALELDIVLWVPAHRSPHKPDARLSPSPARARMVGAACDETPRFSLSTVELDRAGPSYMVDTLRLLAGDPAYRDCHFYLIIGVDQYRAFDLWRDPEKILELATLVVMDRGGEGMSVHESRVGDTQPDRVVRVSVPRVDVSSTIVRRRVAAGEDVGGYVPSGVAAVIAADGLYLE